MSNQPALRLRGLTKTYRSGLRRRRETVLGKVDLDLGAGQVVGLVGPNGSGKSTLLRIAAGVERPSAGEVSLFGRPVSDPHARRRLGYLPEGSPFPGTVRARSMLEFLGAARGLTSSDRRARTRELFDCVGLSGAADKRLGRFSKGMLRRFGLAQAFLLNEGVVLLDEPMDGLDARGFSAFAALMDRARRAGVAVVLCSHGLGEILQHCDEMVVLIEGGIRAQGAPRALGDGQRVRLEIEGLSPETRSELGDWLERRGARVLAEEPGSDLLLGLYERLVKQER